MKQSAEAHIQYPGGRWGGGGSHLPGLFLVEALSILAFDAHDDIALDRSQRANRRRTRLTRQGTDGHLEGRGGWRVTVVRELDVITGPQRGVRAISNTPGGIRAWKELMAKARLRTFR